ncbi:hypothetical protein L6272_03495, partial [Microgenomates group bacterium]|nr:hypothetical protein [Microgenomates group bacterium]
MIGAVQEQQTQIASLSKQLANLLIALQGQSLQAYITQVVEEVLVNKPKFLSPTVETEKLTTNFISPLTDDGQITIKGDVYTEGSISARSASISGTLYAAAINSSTIDAIKEKLASLAKDIIPGVKEVPTSEVESTVSAMIANLQTEPIATDSAYLNIDSINANAGFFSDYLAVIGQATVTDLKINNLLTLGSVSALDGKIDFLAGLMTLSETGQVIINGNLTVTGTIIASQITPPPDQTFDISIASQSAMLIYSDINQPIATFSGQTAQISQLELAASGTAT